MLVLTRKLGERILIGDNISITVIEVRGDSIRLGIDAPRSLPIQRGELAAAVADTNVEAATAAKEAEVAVRQILDLLS